MVLYLRTAEYAIRAFAYLALVPKGQRCKARDIAAREHLPAPELQKILQSFVPTGLVSSARGGSGGFSLQVDPRTIRLIEIVERMHGLAIFQQCLTTQQKCSASVACPLHESWITLRLQLEHITIADIAVTLRSRHH